MKKILMFFVSTALVFGFAGVTGATQFTFSDITNLNPGISVDLTAFVGDPAWTTNWTLIWDNNPLNFINLPEFLILKRIIKKNLEPAPVPEPATMLLFGCGLIGNIE
jgi:hypothetical protein